MLQCDHWSESIWAVLSCGDVYYAVHYFSKSLKWKLLSSAFPTCAAVYCAIWGGSYFWVCGWNLKVWPLKWKHLRSTFTFLWSCLLWCTLNSASVDEILKCDWVWGSKCFLWYCYDTVYGVVVLSFETVHKILKCDHSSESYWAALFCGAVYYTVSCSSKFWVCGWDPKVWPFKWKLLSSTFLWWCWVSIPNIWKGFLCALIGYSNLG